MINERRRCADYYRDYENENMNYGEGGSDYNEEYSCYNPFENREMNMSVDSIKSAE